jgi:hypothetical protein
MRAMWQGLRAAIGVDGAIRCPGSDECAALSAGMLTAWGWKREEGHS